MRMKKISSGIILVILVMIYYFFYEEMTTEIKQILGIAIGIIIFFLAFGFRLLEAYEKEKEFDNRYGVLFEKYQVLCKENKQIHQDNGELMMTIGRLKKQMKKEKS